VRRLALLAAAGLALAVTGCTLQRPEDPVVMTGAQLPALARVNAGDVVAFRWFNGWDQVPVQVDERKDKELSELYGLPRPDWLPTGAYLHATVYADPNSGVGADGDPRVDADDEVALMAKDLGPHRPAGAQPPAGVKAGRGIEVKVRSTLGGSPREAWVYLFERSGNLDPDAGEHYVRYDPDSASGGQVTTPYYSEHFPTRWITDELRIKAGQARAVDILDRHKTRLTHDSCMSNEESFSVGNPATIANKSGPVRAIRSYMGANSGLFTQRDHVFYGQREDIITYLRVHEIPGAIDFFDYSRGAIGMTYRNNNNPHGATIDGNPDTVSPGELTWETVDGSQGALSIVQSVDSDVPGLQLSSYYLDDATPDDPQCSGDSESIGASGPYIRQPLPNTDPANPPSNKLTMVRTMYFDPPGKADGAARAAEVGSAFDVSVSSFP
jgi:hypothetical protein